MSRKLIVDTGVIVALLMEKEIHHRWSTEQFRLAKVPLLSCEAVISEACFLLSRKHQGPKRILDFVQRGAIKIDFQLSQQIEAVDVLMERYQTIPMSFADACLVRMAELIPEAEIITLDRHFKIYRKLGRQVIPTILPPF